VAGYTWECKIRDDEIEANSPSRLTGYEGGKRVKENEMQEDRKT
jgi:hypothetical protein